MIIVYLFAVIAALIVYGLLSIIFGLPFMWLWNWLMPTLFDLPAITLWQSVGLMLLSTLLFGKFNFGSNSK